MRTSSAFSAAAILIVFASTSAILASAAQFKAAHSMPIGETPSQIVNADFNGDGNIDLAVVDASISSKTINIELGDGKGNFAQKASYTYVDTPTSIVAADFNHDGHIDIAFTDSIMVSVMLGNGDGTFQAAVNYTTTLGNFYLHTADLNDDGKLDLVFLSGGSYLGVMLGKGDGTFNTYTTVAVNASGPLVIGDFNGDGRSEEHTSE